jgi:hypothetical protein
METATDVNARRYALEGITACPSVEAYDLVKAAVADKDLQEPAINALISVAGLSPLPARKSKPSKLTKRLSR